MNMRANGFSGPESASFVGRYRQSQVRIARSADGPDVQNVRTKIAVISQVRGQMPTPRNKWIILAISAISFVGITASSAQAENNDRIRNPNAQSLSARVLVVENSESGASKTVAEYYGIKRNIRNLIRISCADAALSPENETIEYSQYLKQIERPIRSYLNSHPAIDFVVLTKGVPIRISRPQIHGSRLDFYSLDSRLAALGYDGFAGAHRVDIRDTQYDENYMMQYHHGFHGKAWANDFWNSTVRFTHERFGGYLVTRLDGYSVADAEALVDRGLEAEQSVADGNHPAGPILLNANIKFGFADKALQPYGITPLGLDTGVDVQITSEDARLGDFNSDLEHTADQLLARGFEVELEKAGQFIGGRHLLMGYVSWGSNDPNFKLDLYRSLGFSPGAIAETAVSTSARTFFHVNSGQSLVADLIAQGVTGVKGYTDEPLIQAVAQPSILFDRYTRGWTLAESFYAASHLLGWQDVVLGDPIARAYPETAR